MSAHLLVRSPDRPHLDQHLVMHPGAAALRKDGSLVPITAPDDYHGGHTYYEVVAVLVLEPGKYGHLRISGAPTDGSPTTTTLRAADSIVRGGVTVTVAAIDGLDPPKADAVRPESAQTTNETIQLLNKFRSAHPACGEDEQRMVEELAALLHAKIGRGGLDRPQTARVAGTHRDDTMRLAGEVAAWLKCRAYVADSVDAAERLAMEANAKDRLMVVVLVREYADQLYVSEPKLFDAYVNADQATIAARASYPELDQRVREHAMRRALARLGWDGRSDLGEWSGMARAEHDALAATAGWWCTTLAHAMWMLGPVAVAGYPRPFEALRPAALCETDHTADSRNSESTNSMVNSPCQECAESRRLLASVLGVPTTSDLREVAESLAHARSQYTAPTEDVLRSLARQVHDLTQKTASLKDSINGRRIKDLTNEVNRANSELRILQQRVAEAQPLLDVLGRVHEVFYNLSPGSAGRLGAACMLMTRGWMASQSVERALELHTAHCLAQQQAVDAQRELGLWRLWAATWVKHPAPPDDVSRAMDDDTLRETLARRIEGVSAALEVLQRHGGLDDAHHKAWAIDQALRHLLGVDGYVAWVAQGGDRYVQDVGTPP